MYLVSSAPRKYEWTISWKATAKGIVSAIPMVSGEGPLETPTGTQAVRNSKLLMLSALEILLWFMCRGSERRDGGLGIDIYPDVGVGVCRSGCFVTPPDGTSPSSDNKSPRSGKAWVNSVWFHPIRNYLHIWMKLKESENLRLTETGSARVRKDVNW